MAGLLRRLRMRSFWPYLTMAGAISWAAFFTGGLHPALALVPVVPFLPHAARDEGVTLEPRRHKHDALNEFEHWWKVPTQIVLLLFGFANAGVPLSSMGPGTWIVLGALLVGKPVGIVLFTWLGTLAGLHRPPRVSWRDLTVLGCAAAIGFTVALFFATAAFPPGPLLDATKMGALFSFAAAVVTFAAAAALRVGRFA